MNRMRANIESLMNASSTNSELFAENR